MKDLVKLDKIMTTLVKMVDGCIQMGHLVKLDTKNKHM